MNQRRSEDWVFWLVYSLTCFTTQWMIKHWESKPPEKIERAELHTVTPLARAEPLAQVSTSTTTATTMHLGLGPGEGVQFPPHIEIALTNNGPGAVYICTGFIIELRDCTAQIGLKVEVGGYLFVDSIPLVAFSPSHASINVVEMLPR